MQTEFSCTQSGQVFRRCCTSAYGEWWARERLALARRRRARAPLWYILVQSIAVIWAHGSFQHYRVVKLAYELQNSCSIRLSQFSEFPQPVRIPYCRGARWLRMCQIASERGLDPFLSTSYRCLDGRFNWQIAHGRIRVYIGKGSKNSLTWKLQPPT